jgi:hypothetical protein
MMFAFGDDLIFLAVFLVAGIAPTCGALYFLRPYRRLWIALADISLVIAGITLIAFVVSFSWGHAQPTDPRTGWAVVAWFWMLITPLFALALVVFTMMAPSRGVRLALAIAAAIEVSAVTYLALIFLRAR